MEITKAKIISIGGKFKPAMFLLNNAWLLSGNLDSSLNVMESGKFYLNLTYHLIHNTPNGNIASEFIGEYNSELKNDGNNQIDDILDLHQHIKNGLIESANFVKPDDIDFQNLVLSKLDIETTYEKIVSDLNHWAFYH
jgi:hypothetical protein